VVSELDPDAARQRRSRLVGLKLRALVSDHLGDRSIGEPAGFSPGAALLHGEAAWVLLDDRPAERLGAALIWAIRAGASSVHLIADAAADTGVLARRADMFTIPISVWRADGRQLVAADPAPRPISQPVTDAHEAFRELIVAGGADPVVEHGVLFGEVRGLEVCRVVDAPHEDIVRLEVGVGAHDREAFQMLHGDVPTVESLARIVRAVELRRDVGASPHPLNRLGAERLLRWRIEQIPGLVGATEVRPAEPPTPRRNLKDPVPCVATGIDAHDRPLRVVCAVGVDLDVIPFAADARAPVEAGEPGVAGEQRLVVVTPSRDRVRVIEQLAGLLRQPVEFVSVD
jgi:hypothetical protein